MKCDSTILKEGDVLSRISYMKIKSIQDNQVQVENENGYSWFITKDIIANECHSADQFDSEETVTRTRLAEMLENEVKDTAFTVQFSKQANEKRAIEILEKELKEEIPTEAKSRKRKLKEIAQGCLEGEKRVLRGHLTRKDAFMGRSTVIDLDIPASEKGNERQVDHRSIDYIIFKRRKYVQK